MKNETPTLEYATKDKKGRRKRVYRRLATILMASSALLSNRTFLSKIGANGFELQEKGFPVWDIAYEYNSNSGTYRIQPVISAGNYSIITRMNYEKNDVFTNKPQFTSGVMVNRVKEITTSYKTIDTIFSRFTNIPRRDDKDLDTGALY